MHDLNMVQKNLIRLCMVNGKKTKSSTTLIKILKELSRSGHDPIKYLNEAVDNVKPILEVKRRSGGRDGSLRSPSLIPTRRQEQKALRWLIEAAEKRNFKLTDRRSLEGAKLSASSLSVQKFQITKPLPTARSFTQRWASCLLQEIQNAYAKTGVARQKRDELHKQVEASR